MFRMSHLLGLDYASSGGQSFSPCQSDFRRSIILSYVAKCGSFFFTCHLSGRGEETIITTSREDSKPRQWTYWTTHHEAMSRSPPPLVSTYPRCMTELLFGLYPRGCMHNTDGRCTMLEISRMKNDRYLENAIRTSRVASCFQVRFSWKRNPSSLQVGQRRSTHSTRSISRKPDLKNKIALGDLLTGLHGNQGVVFSGWNR